MPSENHIYQQHNSKQMKSDFHLSITHVYYYCYCLIVERLMFSSILLPYFLFLSFFSRAHLPTTPPTPHPPSMFTHVCEFKGGVVEFRYKHHNANAIFISSMPILFDFYDLSTILLYSTFSFVPATE